MAMRREFEEKEKLTVVYRQAPCGVTEESKKAFERNRTRIGYAAYVCLAYFEEPGGGWDYLTYVVDVNGRALCFDGFAWGYGGEGPQGLHWLFERLGFSVDMTTLPDPNRVGAWRVHPDGRIAEAWRA